MIYHPSSALLLQHHLRYVRRALMRTVPSHSRFVAPSDLVRCCAVDSGARGLVNADQLSGPGCTTEDDVYSVMPPLSLHFA